MSEMLCGASREDERISGRAQRLLLPVCVSWAPVTQMRRIANMRSQTSGGDEANNRIRREKTRSLSKREILPRLLTT